MNLNTPAFSSFTHDGLKLAFFDEGDPSGPPVLLIHGFASSANVNWVHPGWLKALGDAGYLVIAIDNRGHGASGKPHEPSRYGEASMARDLGCLLDTLGLDEIDLVGYSMGAVVSAIFAATDARVRRLVLSGVGAAVAELGGLDTRALPPAEVAALADAFNEMATIRQAERQGSARRALDATEAERVRVARELHDQVGQTLTGVVLALEEIHRRAPADLGEDLAEVQEAARAGVEQVREIARGLRPGALEELGLRSALTTLANSFTGLRVRHSLPADLPVLSPDQDLAVYRVAQESLTNVARHARARTARMELEEEDGAVVLRISDDGVGIPALHADATDGGVGGMRERALLAGGRLRVRALPERGTEVRLDLWPSP